VEYPSIHFANQLIGEHVVTITIHLGTPERTETVLWATAQRQGLPTPSVNSRRTQTL
jgi:hypothetical protein